MENRQPMSTITLRDGAESFDVTVLESLPGHRVVLFAVGAGGDPGRHGPLLNALVDAGFSVVAPHFGRLASTRPTEDELLLRARRLRRALDAVAQPGVSVAGVGHSIGAAVLLALAGGQMWLGAGHRIDIAAEERLARLVLLAPPTDFFQPEGAFDSLQIPILAWAGSEDTITPPSQIERLADALGGRVPVDVRVTEGAGHFSFMDRPPPHSVEPLRDRQAFLDDLARDIRMFLED